MPPNGRSNKFSGFFLIQLAGRTAWAAVASAVHCAMWSRGGKTNATHDFAVGSRHAHFPRRHRTRDVEFATPSGRVGCMFVEGTHVREHTSTSKNIRNTNNMHQPGWPLIFTWLAFRANTRYEAVHATCSSHLGATGISKNMHRQGVRSTPKRKIETEVSISAIVRSRTRGPERDLLRAVGARPAGRWHSVRLSKI